MSEDEVLAFLVSHARTLGIEPEQDAMVMKRLAEAAARASNELQHSARTNVNLPFLSANASGPIHLEVDVPPTSAPGPRLDPRVKLS